MRARTWAVVATVVACTFPNVTYDDGDSSTDATLDAADEASDEAAPDASDEPNPCDQDNDTFISISCGGNDCDDLDPRVHPGAPFRTEIPDAYPYGDWNCDGDAEAEFPTLACGLGVLCDYDAGFAKGTIVKCGQTGPWESCTGLCNTADAGMKTQGCR